MRWFNRWFYRKTRWAWSRAQYEYPDLKVQEDYFDRLASTSDRDQIVEQSPSTAYDLAADLYSSNDDMRIDVKRVVGGHVITVRLPNENNSSKYASTSIREEFRLTSYVITDDQTFDQELCKILATERLKR